MHVYWYIFQGAAGLIPAYANSNYVVPELVHALKISESTHILVSPPLLANAVSALAQLGHSKDDAKRRVIIMARKARIPDEIQREGWKGVDDLVPDDQLNLPERYDGPAAQETAAIYFSSGPLLAFVLCCSHSTTNADTAME